MRRRRRRCRFLWIFTGSRGRLRAATLDHPLDRRRIDFETVDGIGPAFGRQEVGRGAAVLGGHSFFVDSTLFLPMSIGSLQLVPAGFRRHIAAAAATAFSVALSGVLAGVGPALAWSPTSLHVASALGRSLTGKTGTLIFPLGFLFATGSIGAGLFYGLVRRLGATRSTTCWLNAVLRKGNPFVQLYQTS